MTSAGGAPPTPSVEDDQRASVQAIVLIAVAVLIGVVLLWKGFDEEGGVVAATDSTETTTTTASTSATAPPPIETTTTTAAAPTSPPADVSIVAANASGGTGLAGSAATKLQASGYTDVAKADGPVQAKSAVYYAAGAQADATAVAKALGIDEALVAAMPASPPVPLNGATVLVMLGADQL